MWCGTGEAAMNTDLLPESQNSGMRFIELFAGIGGFSLGFEQAGMRCVAQVEIDKAGRGVLAAHCRTCPASRMCVNLAERYSMDQLTLLPADLDCKGNSATGYLCEALVYPV